MEESGDTVRQVAVYDIESKSWSEGPELPGDDDMEGFGTACFNVGGNLVVSTVGGNVYQLNDEATEWVALGQLREGRFFHRLLPLSEREFILVGGSGMGTGKTLEIPVFERPAAGLSTLQRN
jgi:hypothetical protein